MNTLEMTNEKITKLNKVEDLALDAIRDAFMGTISADSEEAKLAIKTISVVAKNRQTTTHREAINFGMAQIIGSDAELAKYVAATNPQVKKALQGKVA